MIYSVITYRSDSEDHAKIADVKNFTNKEVALKAFDDCLKIVNKKKATYSLPGVGFVVLCEKEDDQDVSLKDLPLRKLAYGKKIDEMLMPSHTVLGYDGITRYFHNGKEVSEYDFTRRWHINGEYMTEQEFRERMKNRPAFY